MVIPALRHLCQLQASPRVVNQLGLALSVLLVVPPAVKPHVSGVEMVMKVIEVDTSSDSGRSISLSAP